jgi:glutathione synthase
MADALKVAVQMDAVESLNPQGDSTLALLEEAQKRGHSIYYYTPDQLFMHNGQVSADMQKLHLDFDQEPFYSLGKSREINLAAMDVVLMRQDPPFDMAYLTYTYFLDSIADKTLVINPPSAVRDCPEKLLVTQFTEYTPPTLITRNSDKITDFLTRHKSIVLKPLYAHGGRDVFVIDQHASNFHAILSALLEKYSEPIIAQLYLSNVTKGDKRIILIDGEAVGAINRLPKKGDIRSNLAQGGEAHKTSLSKREQEICAAIAPELKKRGIMLAGIDVIDGYLTEINLTSPTGIRSIDAFDGGCIAAVFWDKVERLASTNVG